MKIGLKGTKSESLSTQYTKKSEIQTCFCTKATFSWCLAGAELSANTILLLDKQG